MRSRWRNNINRAGPVASRIGRRKPKYNTKGMKMKFKRLESLERKARASIKNKPEFRRLDLKKRAIEKGLAAGIYSRRLAAELKSLLRLRRRRLLNRELYHLISEAAQTA
jgi:hypothetical protein